MGRDKAFIKIDAVPLWQRQLRVLSQLAPSEIFIAGPPHPEWENTGCTILADARAECGPLGGIVAALRHLSSELLLALAVDLPEMSADYLRRLMGHSAGGRGVIPWRTCYEPLAAVYPKRSLRVAERLLDAREYSLQSFADVCVREELAVKQPVSPTDAPRFFNMNTPADIAAVAAEASRKGRKGSQRGSGSCAKPLRPLREAFFAK